MNLAELYAQANQRNALARRREPLDAPFDPLHQIPAGMTPPLRTGDVASMALQNAPGVGDVASLIDAYRAWQMGDKLQGGLSAVAALPFVGAIKAYHGSPHKFDAFDMSKIGTGEGAQAYGHGLYFGQAPEVGDSYRKALSRTVGDPQSRAAAMIENFGGNRSAAAQWFKENIDAELQKPQPDMAYVDEWIPVHDLLASEQPLADKAGYLYETSLEWPDPAREASDPLGPQHFLDWDRPLSEQAELVKRLGANNKDIQWAIDNGALRPPDEGGRWTGKDLYQDLAEQSYIQDGRITRTSKKDATDALRALGIPGIRYLDAGSRGAGEGSSNYVVFSDQIPKITARNGQPVGPLRMATDEELRAKFGGGR